MREIIHDKLCGIFSRKINKRAAATSLSLSCFSRSSIVQYEVFGSGKDLFFTLRWQQKKILYGLLNIIEHLLDKQVLASSFVTLVEKIRQKTKTFSAK